MISFLLPSLPGMTKANKWRKPVLAFCLLYTMMGCDNFTPAPVNFSQQDIVEVGDVQTLELHGRVISSLPVEPPTQNAVQVELGRLLFWDPVLSGDKDVACATCHLPELAYTDGQTQSIGVGGIGRGGERVPGHTGRVPRNAQTAVNTAWNGIGELGVFDPATAPMFWDNREQSLQKQALEPLISREEMRGDVIDENNIVAEIEMRLNNIPEYQLAFHTAFGNTQIDINDVSQALAAFQMSLVANNSPFDRWMRGEADAMSSGEISGMQEFVIAGCADCHRGPLFSDFETHIIGVPEGRDMGEPDRGDGNFAFRTPTLRQLQFTAPYFHAGQEPDLAGVIDFYDEPSESSNPHVSADELDPDFTDLPEMDDGRGDIIESFLNALNDPEFDRQVPSSVPSGLTPGGSLSN